jgi:hypothetical protein
MAKPQKIKNKDGSVSYRIFVNKTIDGKKYRESKSFSTRPLAQAWADKREAQLERESIHGASSVEPLRAVMERYQAQFSHNYGRSKNYDVTRLMNYDIADIPVNRISAKAIIAHCIERNKEAQPQTVLNDVIWIRTILKTMSAVEGFDYDAGVFEKAMQILNSALFVSNGVIGLFPPCSKHSAMA